MKRASFSYLFLFNSIEHNTKDRELIVPFAHSSFHYSSLEMISCSLRSTTLQISHNPSSISWSLGEL